MTDATTNEATDGGAPVRPALAQRVVVVGLGLVGGSFARAVRRTWPATRLVGVDRKAILEAALDGRVVDEGVEPAGAASAIAAADVVVLALPVLSIVASLERWADALRAGPVVTDTGSTKATVQDAAKRLGLDRFVGGHPMAGKSHGGLAHADPDLLRGATWFLCSHEGTDATATRTMRQIVRELGARPVEIDAVEHDRSVALTSHVPHVVANAIAESVLDAAALDAAGGSLKQILQVAGAPFDTWGDTLSTNQAAIRDAMRELIDRLEAIASSLDDKERLRDLFARGRACRERLATADADDER